MMGKLRDRLRTLEDRFVRLELRLGDAKHRIEQLEQARIFREREHRAKAEADRIVEDHFGHPDDGLRDDIAKALVEF